MTLMLDKPRRASKRTLPPLQNGDRLTRLEFERRFDAMPDLKKAELLQGVVYMPPPVSEAFHGEPQFDLIGWLAAYRMATPGVAGGDNGSIIFDDENEPQPDACLRLFPECGGMSHLNRNGDLVGPPEFIAEIAASSASYDLHVKLDVYRKAGVKEYLVWRTYDAAIDWFSLREGRYQPIPLTAGLLKSQVFPGLRLDPAALIRGDLARVGAVLQEGLRDPAHAAFVEKIGRTLTPTSGRRPTKPKRGKSSR